MITQFLQRLLWLVVLVAAQMVVFNYIHIYDYATPLPFVYLVLLFPLGTSRWSILLWAFVCGLLCDIASLTLGIGAASMTLVAFVQPVLLRIRGSAGDLPVRKEFLPAEREEIINAQHGTGFGLNDVEVDIPEPEFRIVLTQFVISHIAKLILAYRTELRDCG